MKADWESIATDIHKHAMGIRDVETGRRLGNMAACARADAKRYAEANAQVMAPIIEAKEKEREEARAQAIAEEEERQKRLAERARRQQESLVQAIDQRMSERGVPMRPKRK